MVKSCENEQEGHSNKKNIPFLWLFFNPSFYLLWRVYMIYVASSDFTYCSSYVLSISLTWAFYIFQVYSYNPLSTDFHFLWIHFQHTQTKKQHNKRMNEKKRTKKEEKKFPLNLSLIIHSLSISFSTTVIYCFTTNVSTAFWTVKLYIDISSPEAKTTNFYLRERTNAENNYQKTKPSRLIEMYDCMLHCI